MESLQMLNPREFVSISSFQLRNGNKWNAHLSPPRKAPNLFHSNFSSLNLNLYLKQEIHVSKTKMSAVGWPRLPQEQQLRSRPAIRQVSLQHWTVCETLVSEKEFEWAQGSISDILGQTAFELQVQHFLPPPLGWALPFPSHFPLSTSSFSK